MAYTKAQMVEQVYLVISGGQPTEDFDVQREDIEMYMSNLINTIALEDSRRRRLEARRDNVGTTGVDASFLTVEYLTVLADDDAGQKYVKFIKKPLLLDDTYGIAEVGPKKGDNIFIKIKTRHDGVKLDYLFTDVTRWYYENNKGEQRIYFKNIAPVVNEVRVAYVPSMDDLDDDELVPLPSGLETVVVDRAVAFFMQEANMPSDDLNNHNDDRNAKR